MLIENYAINGQLLIEIQATDAIKQPIERERKKIYVTILNYVS